MNNHDPKRLDTTAALIGEPEVRTAAETLRLIDKQIRVQLLWNDLQRLHDPRYAGGWQPIVK